MNNLKVKYCSICNANNYKLCTHKDCMFYLKKYFYCEICNNYFKRKNKHLNTKIHNDAVIYSENYKSQL